MRRSIASLHPVLACAESVESALKETADVEVAFMRPEDKRAALLQLARVDAQLAALRLRVMAASDDVALDEGARDVAALAHPPHPQRPAADRRDLALAEALDRRWAQVAAGSRRGRAQRRAGAGDHARAGRASDRQDRDRGAAAGRGAPGRGGGTLRAARAAGAGTAGPGASSRPEVAEQHEAEQLAAEERRAWRRTSLVSTRLGDGTTRITHQPAGRGGNAVAHLPRGVHLAAPPRAVRGGRPGPVDVRRGQAFCALLEACDPKRLPVHGGDATTVIVTVPLESLREELGSGELGPAEHLSAGEVRRLACTAAIIPAVLGGKSEVLDLGRSSRLFKPAQRKAMVVRDRECRAEGCTIPAAWCEAHHWGRPWSKGGKTDLEDGVLLCSWHHHRAHDPTYDSSRLPNGDVRFTRRT